MNKHSNNSSYNSFQYIELTEIDSTNHSFQKYIKPFSQSKPPGIPLKLQFPYNLLSELAITPLIKKRLIVISIFIIIVFLNNTLGLLLPSEATLNLTCISDTVFKLTSSLNNYFHYRLFPRYVLSTVAAFLIDFIFLYSLIDWAFNYTGLRLVLSWGVFYITRGIIQNIYQMSYPDGFFWGCPIPSLVVSYLVTNDFFFSGHVGMPLMAGLHYYHSEKRRMSTLCFGTVGIEAFLVLITRAHYSIDVVVGLSFAHYVFIMVDHYVKYIDACIARSNSDVDIQNIRKGFLKQHSTIDS